VRGPRHVPDRLARPRRPCGGQRDRLLHAPPGSGRADPNPPARLANVSRASIIALCERDGEVDAGVARSGCEIGGAQAEVLGLKGETLILVPLPLPPGFQ
jgi:hypothetical protein